MLPNQPIRKVAVLGAGVMGVRTRHQTANPVAGAERRVTRDTTRLRTLTREPKTFTVAAG